MAAAEELQNNGHLSQATQLYEKARAKDPSLKGVSHRLAVQGAGAIWPNSGFAVPPKGGGRATCGRAAGEPGASDDRRLATSRVGDVIRESGSTRMVT